MCSPMLAPLVARLRLGTLANAQGLTGSRIFSMLAERARLRLGTLAKARGGEVACSSQAGRIVLPEFRIFVRI